jgi:predicted DNA-binding transcriptional regulator AlpA
MSKPTATGRRLTIKQARELPPTISALRAFGLLGMGEAQGYASIAEGTFPVVPIRIGQRYMVPTAPLLKLLGIEV